MEADPPDPLLLTEPAPQSGTRRFGGGPVLRLVLGAVLLGWIVYLCRSGWTREGSVFDIPAPKPWPKVGHFTHLGWHAAALLSLPLCVAGIFRARWLCRRPPVPKDPRPGLGRGERLGFLASAALALALALGNGLPRMTHPLWADEFATFRIAVGEFKSTARNPEPRFFRRSLAEAGYSYEKPNNHQLFSVLGHLCHKRLGGTNKKDPTRPWFSEWKFRLPAFVAALAGLPVLGWLLVRLGQPLAAMLAMPLWALHPWFVRYASEARGYGLCFLLLPLALLFLLAALHGGRRRDWIGFGLGLGLLLLSYFGTLFLVLLAGLAALLAILDQPRARRGPQLAGLLLAGLIALLLWLPGFLPCLPGLRAYLPRTQCSDIARMDADYVRHEVGFFLAGLRHIEWEPGNPHSQSTADLPLPFGLLAGCAFVALAAGCLLLARRPQQRWLLLPLLLGAPLTFGICVARNSYLFPWYLSPALPELLGLAAIGLGGGLRWVSARSGRPLPVALAIGLVALYAWQTDGPRSSLREAPTTPTRETVAVYRRHINPYRRPEADVVSLGIWGTNQMYDPFSHQIRSLASMRGVVAAAVAAEQRVFADIGQVSVAREKQRQIMQLLDDPRLFFRHGPFWGAREALNTRWVYEMRDGPALLAAIDAKLRESPPELPHRPHEAPVEIPDPIPSADLMP